ncbi:MAG: lamin tail protein [Myxococcaceae bacterium]|jgi:hypothetical protein|nr:lamin tail protein [Myxococcaceae bacterium]
MQKHRLWFGLGVLGLGVFAACSDTVVSGSETPDAGTKPVDGGVVTEDDASTVDEDGSVPAKDSGPKADVASDAFKAPDTSGSDAGPVAKGALVINEIDYDQVLTDGAEYIELYNPSSTNTVNMNNLALVFANGSGQNIGEYFRKTLSGNLEPLHYLVLAAPGVAVANQDAGTVTVLRFAAQNNNIQNGDPDGVAIVDTSTNLVIDALSYGGALGTPYDFVEGTVLVAKDSNTTVGALIRDPNGVDTNNANGDWKFSSTLTPGGANVFTP